MKKTREQVIEKKLKNKEKLTNEELSYYIQMNAQELKDLNNGSNQRAPEK